MNGQHSLLIDVYRWKDHPELDQLFNRLWEEIYKGRRKKKTLSGMKHCLKLLLCNLAVSNYLNKPIAVPLQSVNFSRSRYRKLHVKRVPFTIVLNFLKEHGYIEYLKGFKQYVSSSDYDDETDTAHRMYPNGCKTRIWPSNEFRAVLDGLDWVPERVIDDCIVLRDDEKNDIEFEESKFTRGLKTDLAFFNSLLLRYYFTYNTSELRNYEHNPYFYGTCNGDNDNPGDTEEETPATIRTLLREPNHRMCRFIPQIKAVFNCRKFAAGGRFYANNLLGESWQSMPLNQRKTILINNEPVVELDYHSFHITILYAKQGLQLTEDPYRAIDAPRALLKVLLLAAINARTDGETVNGMNTHVHELRSRPMLRQKDLEFLKAWSNYKPDWRSLIEKLREAHEPIKMYFCSGVGMSLQRIDAEIMRGILINLARQNIPCLPVHDSAIVAKHNEWRLKEAMDLSYRGVIGPDFYCPVDKT